eukprot:3711872-Rhodomonas_salina.1
MRVHVPFRGLRVSFHGLRVPFRELRVCREHLEGFKQRFLASLLVEGLVIGNLDQVPPYARPTPCPVPTYAALRHVRDPPTPPYAMSITALCPPYAMSSTPLRPSYAMAGTDLHAMPSTGEPAAESNAFPAQTVRRREQPVLKPVHRGLTRGPNVVDQAAAVKIFSSVEQRLRMSPAGPIPKVTIA